MVSFSENGREEARQAGRSAAFSSGAFPLSVRLMFTTRSSCRERLRVTYPPASGFLSTGVSVPLSR